MAVSTYLTFLMHKASAASEYAKLCDITSYGDIGGSPNLLETTTLTDNMQHFIPGIKQVGDGIEFGANYDKSTYTTLRGLENKEESYAIWKGGTVSGSTVTPTGTDGKWSFNGILAVGLNGGGVDEVFGMTITIAPTSDVDFA